MRRKKRDIKIICSTSEENLHTLQPDVTLNVFPYSDSMCIAHYFEWYT